MPFDTIKIHAGNTLVVAHRGCSSLERENTAAAFIAAGQRSHYGIETDIYRTLDGHFVCLHDNHTSRVAGENVDLYPEKSTLAEMQSVCLLDKNDNLPRTYLRVPTLEDYIAICRHYGKQAVCELKSDFTDDEIGTIIAVFREYEWLDHTTFIAFNIENLRKVRKVLPAQPVQFLTTDAGDETLALLAREKMDLDVQHDALTEERIRAFHNAGITVNCWTVDDPARASSLASWGVDMITSNTLE